MSTQNRDMLRRTELLLGKEAVDNIISKRVILFGTGGVGSWCAESLVRSGIKHITIVDNDNVNISNCNRQLVATSSTIGRSKVEVLKERLLDINPFTQVTALHMVYDESTAESFHLETYDYVIDAIDSLKDKAHLILHATQLSKKIADGELAGEGIARRLTFFSSMGAALRIEPTAIRVTEFWKVKNDMLGRALRKRFKSKGQKPAVKFQCVYSEELPMENKYDQTFVMDEQTPSKRQINGTLSHVTAIFGFTIAGLVIKDITGQ